MLVRLTYAGPVVVGENTIGDDGRGVAGQDGVGDDRLTRLGPRRPPGGVEAAGGGERGDRRRRGSGAAQPWV